MFVSAGGVFLDEHPVTEIIPGQVITIRTAKGTFRTRKLVITAGAWTSEVLRPLGLELPLEVMIYRSIDTLSVLSTTNYFTPEFTTLIGHILK